MTSNPRESYLYGKHKDMFLKFKEINKRGIDNVEVWDIIEDAIKYIDIQFLSHISEKEILEKQLEFLVNITPSSLHKTIEREWYDEIPDEFKFENFDTSFKNMERVISYTECGDERAGSWKMVRELKNSFKYLFKAINAYKPKIEYYETELTKIRDGYNEFENTFKTDK